MSTPAATDAWRLNVAPMIDVTDRHCRYFHRLLAPRARLYTEMITTGALLHGDVARHLDFDPAEHPVALQLGGSEPDALARSARLGRQWGYDEINLNCGCPSERVQKGAFGACLMAEPALVADCVKAMQDAAGIPVTVKHRLGLDYDESYGFARDFVGKLHDAGCRVFVVHARNAVLKGLSPKENREVPPLRYDAAMRLKRDFPDCVVVLNGGLADADQAQRWLQGERRHPPRGGAHWPEVRPERVAGPSQGERHYPPRGGAHWPEVQPERVAGPSQGERHYPPRGGAHWPEVQPERAAGPSQGERHYPPRGDANTQCERGAIFDGVMLGRAAWHTPRVLSELSLRLWPSVRLPSDAQVVDAMTAYASRQVAAGVPLRVIVRPMLGLVNGLSGARRWRRMLSDPARLAGNDPGLIYEAWRSLQTRRDEPEPAVAQT